MKKILITGLIAMFSIGCNDAAKTQTTNSNDTVKSVANTSSAKKDDLAAVSHSSEKSVSTNDNKTASSSSSASTGGSSPMAKVVDVSEMTAKIEKAEKEFKEKSKDAKAKENLAVAYFERAFALTEAAQYRAALGDFRKGLKLKPDDKAAKDMHDQIIDIFRSIGREPPKEGEEPAPMPVEKKN